MRAGRVSRGGIGRSRFLPSRNQSVVVAGDPTALIDAAGVHWTVTASAQMAYNNVTAAATSSVLQIAYVNQAIWQKNSAQDWYSVTLTNGAFTTLSGPTKTSPLASAESAQGTFVNTIGPSVTDAFSEVFTITAGAQVAVGGVTDTTTANVIALLYYNHSVYHENTSFSWYAKASAGATWVFQPGGDPRSAIITQIPVGLYATTHGTSDGTNSAQWDAAVSTMSLAPKVFGTFMDQRFAWDNTTDTADLASYNSYISGLGKQDTRTINLIPSIAVTFGYVVQPANTVLVDHFAAISSGSFDTRIQNMLAAWKANGYTKLYLRPAWEFNLNWSPWRVSASNVSAYIAAHQHFYTVVHAYSAANGMDVQIVWNPSIGVNTNDSSLTVAQQYPGDAFVDVIGPDSYGTSIDNGWNFTGTGGHSPIGAFPTDPTATNNVSYALLYQMAVNGNKQFSISETGSLDALYAQTLIQALNNRPTGLRIAYVVLYPNANDWTTGAFPDAVAAWKVGFQDGTGSVVNRSVASGSATLALDGSVAGFSASAHTQTLTMTTTGAGVIVVVIEANAGPVTGITDSAGMTWTKRKSGGVGIFTMETWYAVSTAARSGVVITITQTGTDFISACAFGVSGVNPTAIFDGNPSLPVGNSAGHVVMSTTANSNFMYAAYRTSSIATPVGGAGFTTISAANFLLVEYKIVSTPQTNLDFIFTSADPNGGVGDALIAG
jgi:hypothetical protein